MVGVVPLEIDDRVLQLLAHLDDCLLVVGYGGDLLLHREELFVSSTEFLPQLVYPHSQCIRFSIRARASARSATRGSHAHLVPEVTACHAWSSHYCHVHSLQCYHDRSVPPAPARLLLSRCIVADGI